MSNSSPAPTPVRAHRLQRLVATLTWLGLLAITACYSPPDTGEVLRGPVAPPRPVPADLRLGPTDLPIGRSGLRLGMAPVLDPSLMRDQYQPLMDYLSDVLGVPVELIITRSYTDLIDRIVGADVDLAILPPASLATALDRAPHIRVLASQIASGTTSYSSYVVVRASSPHKSLKDLAARTVSLVDEVSASGFYLPWAAFLDAGIDPLKDLGTIRFAGSHTAALRDVIDGRSDAAATYSGMLGFARRQLTEFSPASAELRILHKAGRLPNDALCAAPGLPAIVGDKAASAFILLDTRSALGDRVYAGTNNQISGWARPEPDRFDALRQTMRRVDAHRAKSRGSP